MKKLLPGALALMSAALLFAEPLHEWNAHSAGLSWSRKVEFSRNGDAGDFKLLETGEKPWSAIVHFTASQTIRKGERYRCSITAAASAESEIHVVAAQQATKPWTAFSNTVRKNIALTTGFQTFTFEFTADFDYNGLIFAPSLNIGNLPAGTVIKVRNIKFEKI